VIRTLIKSDGEVVVEVSLVRIEKTRSSGKDSKKSEPSSPVGFSGSILFCLLWEFDSEHIFENGSV
jgi:hypothetical protein